MKFIKKFKDFLFNIDFYNKSIPLSFLNENYSIFNILKNLDDDMQIHFTNIKESEYKKINTKRKKISFYFLLTIFSLIILGGIFISTNHLIYFLFILMMLTCGFGDILNQKILKTPSIQNHDDYISYQKFIFNVNEQIFSNKEFQLNILNHLSEKIKFLESHNKASTYKLIEIYINIENLFKNNTWCYKNYTDIIQFIYNFNRNYDMQIDYYELNNTERQMKEKMIGSL